MDGTSEQATHRTPTGSAEEHWARVVLDVTGNGYSGYAGDWARQLVQFAFKCDRINRARLALVFPAPVAMVNLYSEVSLELVVEAAGGHHDLTEGREFRQAVADHEQALLESIDPRDIMRSAGLPTGQPGDDSEPYDGLCVAKGCTKRYLTAWHDGVSTLLLCEEHGDLLAVGFALKPRARENSA